MRKLPVLPLRLWPVLVLAALCSQAQPLPPGPEFQVNVITTYGQARPTVAARGDGSFIVTWSGPEVEARFIGADGDPTGGQFQINSYSTGGQFGSDVAAASDGSFVVVWVGTESPGDDASGQSVHSQKFDSGGFPIGAEMQVNTYTDDDQNQPRVAMTPGGGFVVTWASWGSPGDDVTDRSIQARRFSNLGVPLGDQFQVNTYTSGYEFYPDVAATAEGGFLVVWSGPSLSDPGQGVLGRRYDLNGDPLGDAFQLSSQTSGQQEKPSLALLPDGGLVASWSGPSVADPTGLDVLARRFDSTGDPVGDDFIVNNYSTSGQGRPSVAADSQGNFVVAWDGRGDGPDPDFYSVNVRRFRGDTTPYGPDFQVNVNTTGNQYQHEVAAAPDGSFLVVWRSPVSDGDDDSGTSIQGRFFAGPLFADGFESGDTSAWTSTVP